MSPTERGSSSSQGNSGPWGHISLRLLARWMERVADVMVGLTFDMIWRTLDSSQHAKEVRGEVTGVDEIPPHHRQPVNPRGRAWPGGLWPVAHGCLR